MKISKGKYRCFFNRGIAFFLSISLLTSSVGQAAPALSSPSSALARVHDLKIPEKWGAVEEFFPGNSGKTIIYIQDAHDSLEAQENISKMIRYAVDRYGVKNVFEEGFEGVVPTDKYFGKIKDPEVRAKTAYFLMDKLRIGGAQYAHITRQKDFRLIGADDLTLHKENIRWYQKAARDRAAVEKDLRALDFEIRNFVQKYFSQELKEWLRLKERLDRHGIELLDYLKRTRALSGETGTIDSYPNISLLLDAEKTTDPGLLRKVRLIHGRTLFAEISRLEDSFASSRLRDPRDLEIFHFYKGIQLLKRLNALEVTQEEYEAVKSIMAEIHTAAIARFLTGQGRKSVVLSKAWEKKIQSAVQFYEVAGQRDLAVEKTLTAKSRGMQAPSVLVFGGFHKERIKSILQRNGFSYYILSPKITSMSAKHQRYYKQLMQMGYSSLAMPDLVAKATRSPDLLALAASGSGSEARVQGIIDRIAGIASTGESLEEMNLRWTQNRPVVAASAPRSEVRAKKKAFTSQEEFLAAFDKAVEKLGGKASRKEIAKEMGYSQPVSFLRGAQKFGLTREDLEARGAVFRQKLTPQRQWFIENLKRIQDDPEEKQRWAATILALYDLARLSENAAYALIKAVRTGDGTAAGLDKIAANEAGVAYVTMHKFLVGEADPDEVVLPPNMMDFIAQTANIKLRIEQVTQKKARGERDIPDSMTKIRDKFLFLYQLESLMVSEQATEAIQSFFDKLLAADSGFPEDQVRIVRWLLKVKTLNYGLVGMKFKKKRNAKTVKDGLFGSFDLNAREGFYERLRSVISGSPGLDKEFKELLDKVEIPQDSFDVPFFRWLRSKRSLDVTEINLLSKLIIYNAKRLPTLYAAKALSVKQQKRIFEAYFQGMTVKEIVKESPRLLKDADFEKNPLGEQAIKDWFARSAKKGRVGGIERLMQALDRASATQEFIKDIPYYREEASRVLNPEVQDVWILERIRLNPSDNKKTNLFLKRSRDLASELDPALKNFFIELIEKTVREKDRALDSPAVTTLFAQKIEPFLAQKDWFSVRHILNLLLSSIYLLRGRVPLEKAASFFVRLVQQLELENQSREIEEGVLRSHKSWADMYSLENPFFEQLAREIEAAPQNKYYQRLYQAILEDLFKPVRIIPDEEAQAYASGEKQKPKILVRYIPFSQRFNVEILKKELSEHNRRVEQQRKYFMYFYDKNGRDKDDFDSLWVKKHVIKNFGYMIRRANNKNGIEFSRLLEEAYTALSEATYNYNPPSYLQQSLEPISDSVARDGKIAALQSQVQEMEAKELALNGEMETVKREGADEEKIKKLQAQLRYVSEEKKFIQLLLMGHRAYSMEQSETWKSIFKEVQKIADETHYRIMMRMVVVYTRNQLGRAWQKHLQVRSVYSLDDDAMGEEQSLKETIAEEPDAPERFTEDQINQFRGKIDAVLTDPRTNQIFRLINGLDPVYANVPVGVNDIPYVLAFRQAENQPDLKKLSLITNTRVGQIYSKAKADIFRAMAVAQREKVDKDWGSFLQVLGLKEPVEPEPLLIFVDSHMARIRVGGRIDLAGINRFVSKEGEMVSLKLLNYERLDDMEYRYVFSPEKRTQIKLYPYNLTLGVYSVADGTLLTAFSVNYWNLPEGPKMEIHGLGDKDLPSRSEVRSSSSEGNKDKANNLGFGNFAVMAGKEEVFGRFLRTDLETPVSFYFNVQTDKVFDAPRRVIKARYYYEVRPDQWVRGGALRVLDNFQNGTYRLGGALPHGFSGKIKIMYTVDRGENWIWASQWGDEHFEIQRTLPGFGDLENIPPRKLEQLAEVDAKLSDKKKTWPQIMFSHVGKDRKTHALAIRKEGVITGYMIIEALPNHLSVVRYAALDADPEEEKKVLRALWGLAKDRVVIENKSVLRMDVPLEDITLFDFSKSEEVKSVESIDGPEYYKINYSKPEEVKESEKVTVFNFSENREEELERESIPEEKVPADKDLLRAWVLRQKKAGKRDIVSWRTLRAKYPGVPLFTLRTILGENDLKPEDGYPSMVVDYREMSRADLGAVMEMENTLVDESTRWSAYGFFNDEKNDETEDEQGGLMDSQDEKNTRKLRVAVVDGRIAGYLVYKIFDERIDILKLVVHPAYRFSGIGQGFLNGVINSLKEEGLSFIAVDVPSDEPAPLRLFEKNNFLTLDQQSTDWQKKSLTEMVYWHPDIEASFLKSKKEAARYFKWLKKTRDRMELVAQEKLSKSPKSVTGSLRVKNKHPWEALPDQDVRGPGRMSVIEAGLKHLPALEKFVATHSKLEWNNAALKDFLSMGGRILFIRSSSGEILGYAAFAQEGRNLEVLDVAFLKVIRLTTLLNKFISAVSRQQVNVKDPVERIIWEIPAVELEKVYGKKNLLGGDRFRILDFYDIKEGEAVSSTYLLESRVYQMTEVEKWIRQWAQSVERSAITFETIAAHAAEFGIKFNILYDELERLGARILSPVDADATKLKKFVKPVRDPERVHIRWMIRRDMPEVLQIERGSFMNAWTEEDFLKVLRQRNCIGMVAERGEEVVGLMIYELHRSKLHILKFVVSPKWRWATVGAQLMAKLISKLSSHRRTRLTIEVDERNLNAQLFLRKMKFDAVRILRDEGARPGDDGILFEYKYGREDEFDDFEDEEAAADDEVDEDGEPLEDRLPRAPREARIDDYDMLYAWAKRQNLEALSNNNVRERFPGLDSVDSDKIISQLREQKLIEMLKNHPRESTDTFPYTVKELATIMWVSEKGILIVLGSFGLKAKNQVSNPLNVEIREAEDADFNAFEKIDAADYQLQDRWTYSDFAKAKEEGAFVVTAIFDNTIVGYALYRLNKEGVEILRLSAAPHLRYRDIEGRLISEVKNNLGYEEGSKITMKVSAETAFYIGGQLRKNGFKFDQIVENRKLDDKEYRWIYEVEPLTDAQRDGIVQSTRDIFLRYQEGGLVLHLHGAPLKRDQLNDLKVLYADPINFDGLLKKWFEINVVVDPKTNTLTWKDPDTEALVTRSFESPVEIKEVQQYILGRIKDLQQAKLKSFRRSEVRKENVKRRIVSRDIDKLSVPAGVFIDAKELAGLTPAQTAPKWDELFALVEQHPGFDIYIDGADRYPLDGLALPRLQKLLREYSSRVHLLKNDRANLSKKKILMQVAFLNQNESAQQTQETLQVLKRKYGVKEEIYPLEYTRPGALKSFLDLTESLTPGELIRQVSDVFATLGANGRWRISEAFVSSVWAEMQASYVIQWSA